MADVEHDAVVVEMRREAVDRTRPRRTTAGIVALSLAVGLVLGSVATLALSPASSRVVSTASDGSLSTSPQGVVEIDDTVPAPEMVEKPAVTTVPAHDVDPAFPAPTQAPPTTAAPTASVPPGSAPQTAPARQRFVSALEAEPGWAPTDRFTGTVTVVEAHDGSWYAEVAAEGLQPRYRHGAGVSWDKGFFSAFCTGMSDDVGRWTCTGPIAMQHVPPGAKPMSGDLGEGSGRIWAHGPMRPA